jgi:osmoprotectant transport system ATP-binding protein
VASTDGPLRQALDAALSAPSGRGVIVGPDGVFVGTVRARELIEPIEASSARGRVEGTEGVEGVEGVGQDAVPEPKAR